MSSPTNNSGLRDNHTRGTVADFLRGKCQEGSQLSIVSAYFTIYAYDALKAELERIEHLNFLFGEPSFINRLDPSKTEKKAFIIDAAGLELSNKLQQKRVAKECADWIDRKVDIRTIRQANLLHGKMYHVATAGVEDAVLGSSNFTVRGLGLGNSGNNIELNLIVDGNRDRQELKQWFEELWGNETLVKDVKQDVLNYLINYDIHWNPVRIIQRFGRIDRIGSVNHAVHLVNFWPTEDLNKYINLKNRVEARMALVDLSATFEDNVLKNEEIEDLISDDLRYRDKQLLRLKDEVLDIEDLGDSVSLTEFTLDDFRLELLKYIEANKEALEAAPFGLYTCVPPHPDYKVIGPGVIFCFRQECEAPPDSKPAASESVNPLHPYFLVYVLEDGNPRFGFANPKQILDIYRILCSGKAEAYGQLCNLFDHETNHGSDMKVYDHLLKKAVDSLAVTFRKRAASGLQSGRGFILPNAQEQVHEKTDLELVTWLVIKEAK